MMILVRAYAEVATCRQFGMGFGPVPITVMWQWCEVNGVYPELVAFVVSVLRLVDCAIVKKQNPTAGK